MTTSNLIQQPVAVAVVSQAAPQSVVASVPAVVGPRGSAGAIGADGLPGPQGIQGIQGVAGADGIGTVASVGTLISSATEKTTPVDADMLGVMDSAAGNVLKKLSWSNIKATLKTYFDTLYVWSGGKAGGQTINGGTAAGESLTWVSTSNGTKGTIGGAGLVLNEATYAHALNVGKTTSGVTDWLVNPATKTSGNFFDLQVNGTSKFKVDYTGLITSALGWNFRGGAGSIGHSGSALSVTAYSNTNLYLSASGGRPLILQTPWDGGTGKILAGTDVDDGVNRLQINGSAKATQYNLSALNTAPASATYTGTLGEIRVTATYIYVCTATNTWVRAALATW